MCLVIDKGSKLKVATEDIIVYKRVDLEQIPGRITRGVDAKGHLSEGPTYQMVSGTIKHKYRMNKTYRATLNIEINQTTGKKTVERGIHSFSSLHGARKCTWYGRVLVKCIVPKGSLYYTGSNNGDSRGVASDTIKLVSLV